MSLVSQRGLFPVGEETIKGKKPRKKETYFDHFFFFFLFPWSGLEKRDHRTGKKNSLKLHKR